MPEPQPELRRIADALERLAEIEEAREARRRAPRPRKRELPEPSAEASRIADTLLRRKGLL